MLVFCMYLSNLVKWLYFTVVFQFEPTVQSVYLRRSTILQPTILAKSRWDITIFPVFLLLT